MWIRRTNILLILKFLTWYEGRGEVVWIRRMGSTSYRLYSMIGIILMTNFNRLSRINLLRTKIINGGIVIQVVVECLKTQKRFANLLG